MKNIIGRKYTWFALSGGALLVSILLIISFGLKLGIDFTGGSLLEVRYVDTQAPTREEVTTQLQSVGVSTTVSVTDNNGFIMRFQEVDEETHQSILDSLETLAGEGSLEEHRFDTIGPSVGKELATKSLEAIIFVLLAIIIYIAYAFRKVSYPVQSWKYGLVAIISLFHDILITLGVFVVASRYLGWEINTPFVAAILTILGYSVNDTIVVFDRIRENLHRKDGQFSEVVEESVQETKVRSVNTSFTTILVLLAIFLFGGATIQSFVGTLIIGIAIGTYSSIFLASPLLVLWQELEWKFLKQKNS